MRVLDADGGVALDHPVASERVLSVQTAFQMVSMLGDVVDRGTGAVVRRGGVSFPVGGKTGTTNDFKDAWFVGFSSNLVVGVGWLRSAQADRSRGLRVPLRRADLDRVHETGRPSAPARGLRRPAGLKETTLCRVSYQRPVEGCPTYIEYLKPDDKVPSGLCTIHRGSIKRQVRRAIEGLFSDLGKRIRGSFGKLRLTMNRRDAVKRLLVVLGSARAGAVGPAVSTLIGTGSPGFTDREVNNPHGLTTGPDRRLYFCDLDNQRIRRLDLGTRQTITIAGDGQKRPAEMADPRPRRR